MNDTERKTYGIAPGRGKVAGREFSRVSPDLMKFVYGESDDAVTGRKLRADIRASRPKGNAVKTRRANQAKRENAARLFASLRKSDPSYGNGKPNGNAPIGAK